MSASGAFLKGFFKRGLLETDSPFYSHTIRWTNTARARRFLADGKDVGTIPDNITIPAGFSSWPELCQAQYWEIVTFLSPYLLSSQGDRMAMAHSVEGRYPFLDYRVIEFCNRLPVSFENAWADREIYPQAARSEISYQRKSGSGSSVLIGHPSSTASSTHARTNTSASFYLNMHSSRVAFLNPRLYIV